MEQNGIVLTGFSSITLALVTQEELDIRLNDLAFLSCPWILKTSLESRDRAEAC
jgi:hypothetical protein